MVQPFTSGGHDWDNSKRFDYKRADYVSMRTQLEAIKWEEVLRGYANQDWILFREKVLELEKQYVPITTCRKKETEYLDDKECGRSGKQEATNLLEV